MRPDYPNFGLLADLSHFPLLDEKAEEAIPLIKDYLTSAHLGNCVCRDRKHPAYGDIQPRFGIPGGEIDTKEVVDFFHVLMDNGFFDQGERPIVSAEVRPVLAGETSGLILANANASCVTPGRWRRRVRRGSMPRNATSRRKCCAPAACKRPNSGGSGAHSKQSRCSIPKAIASTRCARGRAPSARLAASMPRSPKARVPKLIETTLSEGLVLGLLRQGVRKYLAIFGHGSTDLGEVLRIYEEEGVTRTFNCRNEVEMAHAATALRWQYGEMPAVVTSIGPGAMQAFAGSLASASNGVGVYHIYGDETTYGEGYNMQQVPKHEQHLFGQMTAIMGRSYVLHTPQALARRAPPWRAHGEPSLPRRTVLSAAAAQHSAGAAHGQSRGIAQARRSFRRSRPRAIPRSNARHK